MDENGNQIKEYQKDDNYIIDISVEDDLIYMTKGSKKTDSFRLAEDDFITYKESDDVKRIDITTKTTSGIAKLYFTVPSNIYLTYIPYLNITKNTVGDRSSDMLITVEDEYAGYMVYDNLGLTGIYDKAGDAINGQRRLQVLSFPRMEKSYTGSRRCRHIIRSHRQSITKAPAVWMHPCGIVYI